MAIRERLYTAEEFFEYAALPQNRDRFIELDSGVIVDISPSTALASVIAARVCSFINSFVIPNELGYVTGPDGGFELSKHSVRQPDVGFISKARLPRIPERFDLPPDLAVEVVSEYEDIFRKAREYLHSGVQMVWAVYPDEQVVYVMNLHLDSSIRATPFGVGDTLIGGHVLPGFTLAVRDIFPA